MGSTGRTTAKRTSGAGGRRKASAAVAPPAKARKAASQAQGVGAPAQGASRLIDERIRSLSDWRGETLARVRRMIHEADPDIVEEIKWAKPTNPLGVPVWSHAGIVCTGEAYRQAVKLTFARGASLPDPRGLFNASLEGNTRRAIDIREGETLDARAFKALVRAAVAENRRSGAGAAKSKAKKALTPGRHADDATPGRKRTDTKATVLLSGGNPQIAKADGDAPVQAYIRAMPGWKRDAGKRLDALIARTVPNVRKAVKWNSPFYGIEGQGWFLSFHVFARYVKVTFFQGTSLRPVPPGGRAKDARWIDIHEDDFDEAQMTDWVKQAAARPGWIP